MSIILLTTVKFGITTELRPILGKNVHQQAELDKIRLIRQNKAHDHDEISISMIKPYAASIWKPVHLILKLSHSPKNGKKQI